MAVNTTTGAWWMRRWQNFMEQVGVNSDATALRGLRVKRLEVQPGQIQAQVAEREHGTAGVEVRLPTLADEQWTAIIDALGSQALFAAQLLAGNMPAEIEQVFADAGSRLLPASAGELEYDFTSAASNGNAGDFAGRALAMVFAQLGEMVADDPWLLLRLRGRDREQVLAALQERRNSTTQDVTARAVPAVDGAAAQNGAFYKLPQQAGRPTDDEHEELEDRVADFWGRRKVLEEAHYHLARPAVELALLRRLGPITPAADGLEAFVLLQQMYHSTTRKAWDMAFAPDDDPEPDEPENGDA